MWLEAVAARQIVRGRKLRNESCVHAILRTPPDRFAEVEGAVSVSTRSLAIKLSLAALYSFLMQLFITTRLSCTFHVLVRKGVCMRAHDAHCNLGSSDLADKRHAKSRDLFTKLHR